MEAEGLVIFVMREWVSLWMEGLRNKQGKAQANAAREERKKALMNRLALEGGNILAVCIRSWVTEWEEATSGKRMKKMGKEEKKAAAMAKIAGNGDRFVA